MNTLRKIIEIDEDLCNGCGECVPSCAEGAIQIVDGKARLIADKYCDGLGACLGECPTGALKVIEREVAAFEGPAPSAAADAPPMACPSAQARTFPERGVGQASSAGDDAAGSALSHWPVQIRLVPPTAPFLDGADLLVTADCVPVAYRAYHRDFLAGKVALMGCPKFDDGELYIQRFADIFAQNDIRTITIVVMEVPCCQGLPWMLEQAMTRAGKKMPTEKVVIGLTGEIVEKGQLVA